MKFRVPVTVIVEVEIDNVDHEEVDTARGAAAERAKEALGRVKGWWTEAGWWRSLIKEFEVQYPEEVT